MKDPGKKRTTGRREGTTVEATARGKGMGHVSLRLYVTGTTRRSTLAIAGIRSVCERYLQGRYDLEVIDLYQQPALARQDQVIATPTLIRRHPVPSRRMVGDMSHQERLLKGLGVRRRA
jgi:circadian clock protein KaiB